MYIRKTDIIKFGETDGCIGCRITMLGKSLRSHTPECQEIIEARLRETDDGQARLQRADHRVTEALVNALKWASVDAITPGNKHVRTA